MIQKVETLVVGAGVIGSSVAMHLAKLGMTDIRVVDFDLEGSLSSSELNAGGVRATWVQPINIEMSQITLEYFSKVAQEVGYKPCGYLWLHSVEQMKAALKARETQIEKGWPVEVWDVAELRRKIPFIDKTEGIEGALFAPRDGLINPNLLKNHFRSEARKAGVQFDDRVLIRQVEYAAESQYPIQVTSEQFESVMSHETKVEALSFKQGDLGRAKVVYQARRVINCAGAWASTLAKLLGYESPSYPLRRQVSIFDSRDLDLSPYGMIVDTSGVYFHPEATNGLSGFATHQEPPGINFNYDGSSFFEEFIWPALYERSTHFEKLKHLTGWAGLYDVSPDECAIMGPVEQGEARNYPVFEAHSFSGHGVMHSYCAGLLLAEKVIQGNYKTLDAKGLSAHRFNTGKLIRESAII